MFGKLLTVGLLVGFLTPIQAMSAAELNPATLEKNFQIAVSHVQVHVNDQILRPATIRWLEQKYRIKIQSGNYWYDARSGLWGLKNGPAVGLFLPNLKLGGMLRANASGGGTGYLTGVFVNGRELHPLDVQTLRALFGSVQRGHFWLDAKGNVGFMGRKAFTNLRVAAQKNHANTFYRNSYTGIGSGSSGGSGYVMGKDWSVNW